MSKGSLHSWESISLENDALCFHFNYPFTGPSLAEHICDWGSLELVPGIWALNHLFSCDTGETLKQWVWTENVNCPLADLGSLQIFRHLGKRKKQQQQQNQNRVKGKYTQVLDWILQGILRNGTLLNEYLNKTSNVDREMIQWAEAWALHAVTWVSALAPHGHQNIMESNLIELGVSPVYC